MSTLRGRKEIEASPSVVSILVLSKGPESFLGTLGLLVFE